MYYTMEVISSIADSSFVILEREILKDIQFLIFSELH